MADEKIKIDMSQYQRPYTRGPKTRKNLAEEFAREFPDVKLTATGEAMYEEMESRLRALRTTRRAEQEKGG